MVELDEVDADRSDPLNEADAAGPLVYELYLLSCIELYALLFSFRDTSEILDRFEDLLERLASNSFVRFWTFRAFCLVLRMRLFRRRL